MMKYGDQHRNPNINIREIIWLGNQLVQNTTHPTIPAPAPSAEYYNYTPHHTSSCQYMRGVACYTSLYQSPHNTMHYHS